MNNLHRFLINTVPKINGHYKDVVIKTNTFEEFKEVLHFCDRCDMKWGDGSKPFEDGREDSYFDNDDGSWINFCYEPYSETFRIYTGDAGYVYADEFPFDSLGEFVSEFMRYTSTLESFEVGDLL